MSGLVVAAIIGFIVYSMSKSQPGKRPLANNKDQQNSIKTSPVRPTRTTEGDESRYKVSSSGFQPVDICTCGGTWIKRKNSSNGGVFFSCSNFPRCKKSRDEVLRQKLGDRYSDFYCSRGHSLEKHGTTASASSSRGLCKRCIALGYIRIK